MAKYLKYEKKKALLKHGLIFNLTCTSMTPWPFQETEHSTYLSQLFHFTCVSNLYCTSNPTTSYVSSLDRRRVYQIFKAIYPTRIAVTMQPSILKGSQITRQFYLYPSGYMEASVFVVRANRCQFKFYTLLRPRYSREQTFRNPKKVTSIFASHHVLMVL